jgi:hypothetical protein
VWGNQEHRGSRLLVVVVIAQVVAAAVGLVAVLMLEG